MTEATEAAESVAIGVCTCQRPEGLAQLLAAVDRLRLDQISDRRVLVILVDNSADGYAQDTAARYAQNGRFSIAYRHERRRGLCYARNCVLNTARELGVDLVASIDDDEAPHPDWLATLIATREAAGTELVIGPVRPVFEVAPPRWLPASAYETRRPSQNGTVSEGYTCNALISMRAVDDAAVAFDPRFNKSGGEDTAFFAALINAGHEIAWAEQALVYETIPLARMSLRWLLRRWYLTGLNQGRLVLQERSGRGAELQNVTRGLARLVGGSGQVLVSALLWGWRRPDRVVLSCYTTSRGIGYLASAVGREAGLYAKPGYH